MQMIMELLKETFILIFGMFVLGLILKLFFKHTLLGKIIGTMVIDMFLFVKWRLRIIKKSGKAVYKTSKRINTILKKKTSDKKVKSKKQSNKVVNGNNIIDFNSAKQLRHKWNK
jgi:uncharacterized protein YacL